SARAQTQHWTPQPRATTGRTQGVRNAKCDCPADPQRSYVTIPASRSPDGDGIGRAVRASPTRVMRPHPGAIWCGVDQGLPEPTNVAVTCTLPLPCLPCTTTDHCPGEGAAMSQNAN